MFHLDVDARCVNYYFVNSSGSTQVTMSVPPLSLNDAVPISGRPGSVDYTGGAVDGIAFGRRAGAVDANVEHVGARLFAIRESLPAARGAIRHAAASITPDARAGDLWQAVMDLGQAICTPRAPKCLLCPLAQDCEIGRAHV